MCEFNHFNKSLLNLF